MLHPADLRFIRTLTMWIDDETQTRMESLGSGGAQDYAEYRQRVGYLKALADVRAQCEEIERDSDPEDPRK